MFSQTVEYALRAMICLASLERAGTVAVPNDRISQLTQIPPGYLSKIIRSLVVGGLVGSQRGPHGGFTLARAPETISLLDVVQAVDAGHAGIRGCESQIEITATPLRQRLDRVTQALLDSLREATLAQVLGEVTARSTGEV